MAPTMKLLKPLWTIVWKTIAFLLLLSLLFALLIPIAQFLSKPEFRSSLPIRLFFEFSSVVIVLTAAWCMVRFIDRRPFITLGFAPNHAIRDSIIGFSMGAGLIIVSVAILWLGGWIQPNTTFTLVWVNLALTGIAMFLNSIAQEVIFRGYVFQTIQSKSNSIIAIVVSAIIFMAFHAGSISGKPMPAMSLFTGGLLYGLAYVVTGNLWLPIALHFGWNYLQGPVLGLPVSRQALDSGWQILSVQGPEIITGGAFGVEGGLIALLMRIVGILTILVLYGKQRNESGAMPSERMAG
jgi:membrane protease YdiL (CAAX protease family)